LHLAAVRRARAAVQPVGASAERDFDAVADLQAQGAGEEREVAVDLGVAATTLCLEAPADVEDARAGEDDRVLDLRALDAGRLAVEVYGRCKRRRRARPRR
jgi:hypothetical protein